MKISVRNAQNHVRINVPSIKRLILQVLKEEKTAGAGEISLCVSDDREIRKVNRIYLGKDCPTDVIAFDLSGGRTSLYGDIIVSAETACACAREFRTAPAYELYLYIIHGVLHVLGYDDRTKQQRARMHKRELQLLNSLTNHFSS